MVSTQSLSGYLGGAFIGDNKESDDSLLWHAYEQLLALRPGVTDAKINAPIIKHLWRP